MVLNAGSKQEANPIPRLNVRLIAGSYPLACISLLWLQLPAKIPIESCFHLNSTPMQFLLNVVHHVFQPL